MDRYYSPDEAVELFKDEQRISSATLPEIKVMLTYFVRGERFNDGHWGALIEAGLLKKILVRLRSFLIQGE
jgi:hypothetical protein